MNTKPSKLLLCNAQPHGHAKSIQPSFEHNHGVPGLQYIVIDPPQQTMDNLQCSCSMVNTAATNIRKPSDCPDVTSWCCYLASHLECKNNVDVVSIGDALKSNGFTHITQLTLGCFGWKDLKDCLGIAIGTAVLILHYAKEDVQAIDEGQLVPFPPIHPQTIEIHAS